MLDTVIHFFAYSALIVTAAATYLQMNKVWSRKHLPEVAASLSIPGMLLESLPLFFYGVYYLSKAEWLGILDSIIWLVSTAVWILIASGYWVKGQRKKGFWRLFRESVLRERAELSVLARELVHPSSTSQLIDVLTSMAAADGDVHQREQQLINAFADEWNLVIDWEEIEVHSSQAGRLVGVKNAVGIYLDTTPSHDQAAQLKEVLQLLIDADESRSEEEQFAFDEAQAQISQYLSDDDVTEDFHVVIAPQDERQDEAIQLMLKNAEPHYTAGGKAYTVGAYFSEKYADMICAEYRAHGFFTVILGSGAFAGRAADNATAVVS